MYFSSYCYYCAVVNAGGVTVLVFWCCVVGMDSSHGQVIYTDESGQMRLYTPNVNKALQTHLNSTHTELGAPLENQVDILTYRLN